MKEEFINDINNNELNMFLAKTKSKIWIDSNEEEVLVDFSWVDKVEECLPYLDTIIRNPKRFLIQEEEVINVEKSKKVTTETVRHLAQHSNFIDDVEEESGEVRPKKVLNITKEDTIDIYENRFIYTLFKTLSAFIDNQIERFGDDGSYYQCDRKVTFEGQTKVKDDRVKINVTLENNRRHEIPIVADDELSMPERIKEIKTVLDGFKTTEFIKSLVSVAPVRSPLRKTNLILKEPNFKKAAELWDYLEQFNIIDPKVSTKTEVISDNKDVEEFYNFGYFLNYDALNLLNSKYPKRSSNLYNVAFIKNLIEDYLDEIGGSEKVFTKMLKDQFKIVLKARKKREKEIKRICANFIQTQNDNLRKCEDLLR